MAITKGMYIVHFFFFSVQSFPKTLYGCQYSGMVARKVVNPAKIVVGLWNFYDNPYAKVANLTAFWYGSIFPTFCKVQLWLPHKEKEKSICNNFCVFQFSFNICNQICHRSKTKWIVHSFLLFSSFLLLFLNHTNFVDHTSFVVRLSKKR